MGELVWIVQGMQEGCQGERIEGKLRGVFWWGVLAGWFWVGEKGVDGRADELAPQIG